MGKKKRTAKGNAAAGKATPASSDLAAQTTSAESPRSAFAAPLAVLLASLAVYVPRLCRTVAMLGDSPVFTSAAIVWGVPQPSGYPLLTLVGHLFSRLPFAVGDLAWRVHLTSAVFHAAAAAVVADTIRRITGSWIAGVGGGLFLAFSGLFFFGSLYTEAFPLNDLFTSIVFAIALSVERARVAARADRDVLPLLTAFVIAVAFASAHHQMISLSAPALAILVVPTAHKMLRRRRRRLAALVVTFVAIVAAVYALVPIASSRDPWVNWGDVHDLDSLVRLVTRADYGGMFSPALATAKDTAGGDRVAHFVVSTWSAFGVVGCALAALGAFALWGGARRSVTALLVGVAVAGPVFAIENAIPIAVAHGAAFAERFFTMAHVIVAILVGCGLARIERAAVGYRITRFFAPALGLVWIVPFAQHSAVADLRHDRLGAAFAHDLVSPLGDRALALVTGDDLVGAAAWACAVERRCEGRAVFSPGQLHMPWRVQQLRRRHPDIVIRDVVGRRLRATEVVADNTAAHPVWISASLLELDAMLRDAHGYLPDSLLLAVTSDDEIEAQRESFIARARRMLDPAACQGCANDVRASTKSPLEDGVVRTYSTALENHAKILRVLFDDALDAAALDARTREGR